MPAPRSRAPSGVHPADRRSAAPGAPSRSSARLSTPLSSSVSPTLQRIATSASSMGIVKLFGQIAAQSADSGAWRSWQFRTSDAPHIQAGELEALRRQYETRGQARLFQQEFEA